MKKLLVLLLLLFGMSAYSFPYASFSDDNGISVKRSKNVKSNNNNINNDNFGEEVLLNDVQTNKIINNLL